MKKQLMMLAVSRSGHNFVRQQIETWDSEHKYTILNAEDLLPELYQQRLEDFTGPGNTKKDITNIIVVRDLLNWWASYITWVPYETSATNYFNVFKVWMQHAREALDDTSYVPMPKIIIHYDNMKDINYRTELAKKLGLKLSDKNLNKVPPQGGGSSFSKLQLPGYLLDTHNRYRQVQSTRVEDRYIAFLQMHPEAIALYRRLFQLTDDQEQFLRNINL